MTRDFIKERVDGFVGEAPDAAALVMGYVQTYSPSSEEIERLLTLMFARVREEGATHGRRDGAEEERTTNPILKGLGTALQEAVAAWKASATLTMRKIFEAETAVKQSNPYYAFEQALKAIS